MVAITFFLAFSALFAQTYYVTSSGTDSSSCGAQATPCATINQVLLNYPNASYTISVASGTYPTKSISLAGGVTVTIQGTGNPTIAATNATGGLVWQDVTIALSGPGRFTVQSAATDATVVKNTVITISGKNAGDDIFTVNGGSLLLNNVTVDGANFDSYFIVDESNSAPTNVSVVGSTLNNLTIGEDGAILVFDAYGTANLLIDSTTFSSIQTGYVSIGFWAEDSNQTLTLSNLVFNNTNTYLPSVYVENDNGLVVNVQNSSWTNAVAGFVCGGLETLGPDNGVDHNITLNNLTFTNNNGPYAGALLVAYNSLNLSNSTFVNNRGQYGNDVVQGVDDVTSNLGESIINSTSTSAQPRAVIWNLSTGSVTDISDQLPDSTSVQPVKNIVLSREKISAAPKFGRKQKKN